MVEFLPVSSPTYCIAIRMGNENVIYNQTGCLYGSITILRVWREMQKACLTTSLYILYKNIMKNLYHGESKS
jgi:hypothetical protein